jgi:hypothetical protein
VLRNDPPGASPGGEDGVTAGGHSTSPPPHVSDSAQEALRVIYAARADGIALWIEDGKLRAYGEEDELSWAMPALRAHRLAVIVWLRANPGLGASDQFPPGSGVLVQPLEGVVSEPQPPSNGADRIEAAPPVEDPPEDLEADGVPEPDPPGPEPEPAVPEIDSSQEAVKAQAISYSRGRDKFDAWPEQLVAPRFAAFAETVLAERSAAKGLTWISGPFAQNGAGQHHRCRDGALPRRFLPLDLDGASPDAFAELCMMLGEYSGFGYTTASHTTESPHARFILELSRPVDRAEGIRLGQAMQQRIEARLSLGAEGSPRNHTDVCVWN